MACNHKVLRFEVPGWAGEIVVCSKCKVASLPRGKRGEDLTTHQLRELVKIMGETP